MNSTKNKYLAGPYLIWMTGFIIIPLLMIFYYGLTSRDGAFTFENIASIGTPEHLKALVLSLVLAGISTAVCLLIAYPLALILRNRHIGRGSFVVFIFILPMWMNFLLRTLAWQTLLEKNGVVNALLSALHLPALAIINTPAAIVLGMVYNFLPFMVLPIYNVMAKIDDSVINAARDLGANSAQTLFKIILPLSVPASGSTRSMSSGRMTTSTGLLTPKPLSTQANFAPEISTSSSRSMSPSTILLSPMKSATKAFSGSL